MEFGDKMKSVYYVVFLMILSVSIISGCIENNTKENNDIEENNNTLKEGQLLLSISSPITGSHIERNDSVNLSLMNIDSHDIRIFPLTQFHLNDMLQIKQMNDTILHPKNFEGPLGQISNRDLHILKPSQNVTRTISLSNWPLHHNNSYIIYVKYKVTYQNPNLKSYWLGELKSQEIKVVIT